MSRSAIPHWLTASATDWRTMRIVSRCGETRYENIAESRVHSAVCSGIGWPPRISRAPIRTAGSRRGRGPGSARQDHHVLESDPLEPEVSKRGRGYASSWACRRGLNQRDWPARLADYERSPDFGGNVALKAISPTASGCACRDSGSVQQPLPPTLLRRGPSPAGHSGHYRHLTLAPRGELLCALTRDRVARPS
jgi:hypothetical protein